MPSRARPDVREAIPRGDLAAREHAHGDIDAFQFSAVPRFLLGGGRRGTGRYRTASAGRFLVAASCYFYMALGPRAYILILFAVIMVDWVAGLWIAASEGWPRKIALWTSLAANIGILAVFKYWGFFRNVSEDFAQLLGFSHASLPMLSLILPIGLSFHTFQSMSYTIEVYWKRQAPERHLGIYSLYVLFFPQMVAGPIERPQNVLHQPARTKDLRRRAVLLGIAAHALGIVQKGRARRQSRPHRRRRMDRSQRTWTRPSRFRVRLLLPDPLRLLGIFRHRARFRRDALGNRPHAQFRPARTSRFRSRNSGGAGTSGLSSWFRGLRLHPPGRLARRATAPRHQLPRGLHAQRILAWSRLGIRPVGGFPRSHARASRTAQGCPRGSATRGFGRARPHSVLSPSHGFCSAPGNIHATFSWFSRLVQTTDGWLPPLSPWHLGLVAALGFAAVDRSDAHTRPRRALVVASCAPSASTVLTRFRLHGPFLR